MTIHLILITSVHKSESTKKKLYETSTSKAVARKCLKLSFCWFYQQLSAFSVSKSSNIKSLKLKMVVLEVKLQEIFTIEKFILNSKASHSLKHQLENDDFRWTINVSNEHKKNVKNKRKLKIKIKKMETIVGSGGNRLMDTKNAWCTSISRCMPTSANATHHIERRLFVSQRIFTGWIDFVNWLFS